MTDIVSYCLD